MLTRDAQFIWNRLNGIVCLYKPPRMSIKSAKKVLRMRLADDLNQLDCRPRKPYIDIAGDTTKPLNINVRPSYADHPLAIGPSYIPEEIKALSVFTFSPFQSGVCVVGINDGLRKASYLKQCNPLSTFHITGQFGILTNDKTIDGNIIYRCSYKYLKKHNIDKAVSAIEAHNQKSLFTLMGVNPRSQEAYDMLSKGLVRPVDNKYPLIYNIKCIGLDLPYFTLEVVATNEEENHLLNIVDEIGTRLTNCAITTSIQCIRCAYFSLEDALLKKHWNLQNVIDNMAHCDKILANNRHFCEFLQEAKKEEKSEFVEDIHDEHDELEEFEKNIS